MSNIINPIKDAKGNIKTNVTICKEMYNILKKLQESNDEREREAFIQITNNGNDAQAIMDWLKQINDIKDPYIAQKQIEQTLIGLDLANVKNKTKQTKLQRIKGGM